MARTLAITLLLLAAVAGCGGGKSSLFDAIETQACLERNGVRVDRADADYIALDAVNGGYLVTVGQTKVNVSFYRNSSDAHDHLRPYEAFGGSQGPKLYTKGNALLAWDDTPTDDEKTTVDGCLTSAP